MDEIPTFDDPAGYIGPDKTNLQYTTAFSELVVGPMLERLHQSVV